MNWMTEWTNKKKINGKVCFFLNRFCLLSRDLAWSCFLWYKMKNPTRMHTFKGCVCVCMYTVIPHYLAKSTQNPAFYVAFFFRLLIKHSKELLIMFSITLNTEYHFFVHEKHFHLIYRTTLVLMLPPWPILLHSIYCFYYYYFLNFYNLWCPRDHSVEFSFLYMNSYFRQPCQIL